MAEGIPSGIIPTAAVLQSGAPTRGGASTILPSALAAGNIIEGTVVSRDAQGTTVLRTAQGNLTLQVDPGLVRYLLTNSEVRLRIDTQMGQQQARILSIDGTLISKLPATTAPKSDPSVIVDSTPKAQELPKSGYENLKPAAARPAPTLGGRSSDVEFIFSRLPDIQALLNVRSTLAAQTPEQKSSLEQLLVQIMPRGAALPQPGSTLGLRIAVQPTQLDYLAQQLQNTGLRQAAPLPLQPSASPALLSAIAGQAPSGTSATGATLTTTGTPTTGTPPSTAAQTPSTLASTPTSPPTLAAPPTTAATSASTSLTPSSAAQTPIATGTIAVTQSTASSTATIPTANAGQTAAPSAPSQPTLTAPPATATPTGVSGSLALLAGQLAPPPASNLIAGIITYQPALQTAPPPLPTAAPTTAEAAITTSASTGINNAQITPSSSPQPLLVTQFGTFRLPPHIALPEGAHVYASIQSGTIRGENISESLILRDQTTLANRWQAMEHTLHSLQGIDPQFASLFAQQRVPQLNTRMLATTLFFLSALRGQTGLSGWLGNTALQQLQDDGKHPLIMRLQQDFSTVQQLWQDTRDQPWQTTILPLYHEERVEQAKLFLKQKRASADENGLKTTRFIVEIRLSAIGKLQLDGFFKHWPASPQQTHDNKHFSLTIRTQNALEHPLKQELTQHYHHIMENLHITGSIDFSVEQEFPTAMMDSRVNATLKKLIEQ